MQGGQDMKQGMGKVLVLGSDTRSFLSVVRSLGRYGLSVHVGWCPSGSPALRSRYIRKIHRIPEYSQDDHSWKRELIRLMKEERFELVIPCNDPSIIPLYLNRKELEVYGRLALLHESAFEQCFDKAKTSLLARSLGISVPKEIRISKMEETKEVLEKLSLPVVIKPISSYTKERLSKKRFVRKAYTPEQLRGYLNTALSKGEVLVQENFIGTGMGVEVMAANGNILVAFQHVRVHEPLMGGGSSYRKSVPLNPELLAASAKLMKALDYTSVAMLEFKMNLKTEKWVLIEINGRFWGSLPLAMASGVDFPRYLYQMLVEGKMEFPQDYKTNIHCRNLLIDLGWMKENLHADKNDPTLATRPLPELAKEVFNILRLRERSDTFVLDDPRPAIAELVSLTCEATALTWGRIRVALLSISPVRKLLSKKLRKETVKAKSILFACKGNICRSPVAAHYIRQYIPDHVEVSSVGYYPREGRAPPQEAMMAASELGIDLSSHSSRVLDEKIMKEADIIFIFDEENHRIITRKYPFAREKINFLGLLSDEGSVLIEDPYGKNINDFRRVYTHIKNTLDFLVKDQNIQN